MSTWPSSGKWRSPGYGAALRSPWLHKVEAIRCDPDAPFDAKCWIEGPRNRTLVHGLKLRRIIAEKGLFTQIGVGHRRTEGREASTDVSFTGRAKCQLVGRFGPQGADLLVCEPDTPGRP